MDISFLGIQFNLLQCFFHFFFGLVFHGRRHNSFNSFPVAKPSIMANILFLPKSSSVPFCAGEQILPTGGLEFSMKDGSTRGFLCGFQDPLFTLLHLAWRAEMNGGSLVL